eukprot:1185978-Prorocentrum_minimum.AAC.1
MRDEIDERDEPQGNPVKQLSKQARSKRVGKTTASGLNLEPDAAPFECIQPIKPNQTPCRLGLHFTNTSPSDPLQTPFRPPSDPLQTPFRPPSDPLQTPFRPPSDPLHFRPPSDPLQTPFRPLSDPLQTPFRPPPDPDVRDLD